MPSKRGGGAGGRVNVALHRSSQQCPGTAFYADYRRLHPAAGRGTKFRDTAQQTPKEFALPATHCSFKLCQVKLMVYSVCLRGACSLSKPPVFQRSLRRGERNSPLRIPDRNHKMAIPVRARRGAVALGAASVAALFATAMPAQAQFVSLTGFGDSYADTGAAPGGAFRIMIPSAIPASIIRVPSHYTVAGSPAARTSSTRCSRSTACQA